MTNATPPVDWKTYQRRWNKTIDNDPPRRSRRSRVEDDIDRLFPVTPRREELFMSEELAPLIAMSGKHAPRVQKAMTYFATAQMVFNTGKRIHTWYKERSEEDRRPEDQYVIFMEEDDNLVIPIMRYIQDTNSFVDEKVLRMTSESRWVVAEPDDTDADEDGEVYKTIISLRPDEEVNSLNFTIPGGYEITAKLQTGKPGQDAREAKSQQQEMANGYSTYRDWDKYLILSCRGEAAFESLSQWLRGLIKPRKRGEMVPTSTLYVYSTVNSQWAPRHTTRQRSMDSVTLPVGRAEALLADLKEFRESEQDYVDYGVAYHRGYLLYGPPGTGKTSFVTTLAAHLGIDLYLLSLSELKSNNDLTKALGGLSRNSIVLFEDVDVVVPDRDGRRSKDAVTLDHLLQVMDGVLTPHGAIFIMTTNEPDKLDPALVRSGRMDLQLEFGHLEDDQASRMVERFLGRKVDLPPVTSGVMPADLAGIFKRYLRSREDSLDDIRWLLANGSVDKLARELESAGS